MANSFDISDDQREIELFNKIYSSLSSVEDYSRHISDSISDVDDSTSKMNGMFPRFLTAVQSVGRTVSGPLAYANEQYGPFHKPNFVKAATMAAGPIGTVIADTLVNSGLAERIGDGVKGAVGGLGKKLFGLFKRNEDDERLKSGYLDPRNMTTDVDKMMEEKIPSMENYARETSKILEEQLNETKRSNKEMISALYDVQAELSGGKNKKTGARSSTYITGVTRNDGGGGRSNDLSASEKIARRGRRIRLNQKYNKNISAGDGGGLDTDAIVSSIQDLKSSLVDPSVKPQGALGGLASLGAAVFGLRFLFNGRYAKDIHRSKNPFETTANALIKIYEWQRIYGDLSRRQLNELIRLGGGRPQKIVGQESVFTTFVKNGVAKLKNLIDSKFGEKSTIGKALKSLTSAVTFFVSQDTEDEKDKEYAGRIHTAQSILNDTSKDSLTEKYKRHNKTTKKITATSEGVSALFDSLGNQQQSLEENLKEVAEKIIPKNIELAEKVLNQINNDKFIIEKISEARGKIPTLDDKTKHGFIFGKTDRQKYVKEIDKIVKQRIESILIDNGLSSDAIDISSIADVVDKDKKEKLVTSIYDEDIAAKKKKESEKQEAQKQETGTVEGISQKITVSNKELTVKYNDSIYEELKNISTLLWDWFTNPINNPQARIDQIINISKKAESSIATAEKSDTLSSIESLINQNDAKKIDLLTRLTNISADILDFLSNNWDSIRYNGNIGGSDGKSGSGSGILGKVAYVIASPIILSGSLIKNIGKGIGGAASGIGSVVGGAASLVGKGAGGILSGSGSLISGALSLVSKTVGGLIGGTVSIIESGLGGIINTIVSVLNGGINVVGSLLGVASSVVGKGISGVGSLIGKGVGGIRSIASGAGSILAKGIGGGIGLFSAGIGGISNIIKGTSSLVSNIVKGGGAAAFGSIEGIAKIVAAAVGSTASVFKQLYDKTKNTTADALSKLGDIFKDGKNWIGAKIENTREWITDKIKGGFDWIKNKVSRGKEKVKGGINWIKDNTIGRVRALRDKFQNTTLGGLALSALKLGGRGIGSIAGGIGNLFKSMFGKGKKKPVEEINENIRDKAVPVLTEIKSVLDNILECVCPKMTRLVELQEQNIDLLIENQRIQEELRRDQLEANKWKKLKDPYGLLGYGDGSGGSGGKTVFDYLGDKFNVWLASAIGAGAAGLLGLGKRSIKYGWRKTSDFTNWAYEKVTGRQRRPKDAGFDSDYGGTKRKPGDPGTIDIDELLNSNSKARTGDFPFSDADYDFGGGRVRGPGGPGDFVMGDSVLNKYRNADAVNDLIDSGVADSLTSRGRGLAAVSANPGGRKLGGLVSLGLGLVGVAAAGANAYTKEKRQERDQRFNEENWKNTQELQEWLHMEGKKFDYNAAEQSIRNGRIPVNMIDLLKVSEESGMDPAELWQIVQITGVGPAELLKYAKDANTSIPKLLQVAVSNQISIADAANSIKHKPIVAESIANVFDQASFNLGRISEAESTSFYINAADAVVNGGIPLATNFVKGTKTFKAVKNTKLVVNTTDLLKATKIAKWGAKGARAAKFATTGVPVVGDVVGAGAGVLEIANGQVGRGTYDIASSSVPYAGAAIGAAVGSIIPGAGTAAGAAVGYTIGNIVSIAMDAAQAIWDLIPNQHTPVMTTFATHVAEIQKNPQAHYQDAVALVNIEKNQKQNEMVKYLHLLDEYTDSSQAEGAAGLRRMGFSAEFIKALWVPSRLMDGDLYAMTTESLTGIDEDLLEQYKDDPRMIKMMDNVMRDKKVAEEVNTANTNLDSYTEADQVSSIMTLKKQGLSDDQIYALYDDVNQFGDSREEFDRKLNSALWQEGQSLGWKLNEHTLKNQEIHDIAFGDDEFKKEHLLSIGDVFNSHNVQGKLSSILWDLRSRGYSNDAMRALMKQSKSYNNWSDDDLNKLIDTTLNSTESITGALNLAGFPVKDDNMTVSMWGGHIDSTTEGQGWHDAPKAVQEEALQIGRLALSNEEFLANLTQVRNTLNNATSDDEIRSAIGYLRGIGISDDAAFYFVMKNTNPKIGWWKNVGENKSWRDRWKELLSNTPPKQIVQTQLGMTGDYNKEKISSIEGVIKSIDTQEEESRLPSILWDMKASGYDDESMRYLLKQSERFKGKTDKELDSFIKTALESSKTTGALITAGFPVKEDGKTVSMWGGHIDSTTEPQKWHDAPKTIQDEANTIATKVMSDPKYGAEFAKITTYLKSATTDDQIRAAIHELRRLGVSDDASYYIVMQNTNPELGWWKNVGENKPWSYRWKELTMDMPPNNNPSISQILEQEKNKAKSEKQQTTQEVAAEAAKTVTDDNNNNTVAETAAGAAAAAVATATENNKNTKEKDQKPVTPQDAAKNASSEKPQADAIAATATVVASTTAAAGTTAIDDAAKEAQKQAEKSSEITTEQQNSFVSTIKLIIDKFLDVIETFVDYQQEFKKSFISEIKELIHKKDQKPETIAGTVSETAAEAAKEEKKPGTTTETVSETAVKAVKQDQKPEKIIPKEGDKTAEPVTNTAVKVAKEEATPETVTNTAVKEAEKEAKPQTTPEEAAKKAAEEAKKEAERQELRKKVDEMIAKSKAAKEARRKKEEEERQAKLARDDENKRKVYADMYTTLDRALRSVPQDMSDPSNYLSALRIISATKQAYDKSWQKYRVKYSVTDPDMTKWKRPGAKTLPKYTPGKQQNLDISRTGFFLPGSSRQEMPRSSYIRSDGSIDTMANINTLAQNVPEVQDALTKMSDALLARIPVQQEGKEKGKPTADAVEYLPILNMRKVGTISLEIFDDALKALDKKFTKTEQQSVSESEKEIGNLIDSLVKHTNITKEDAEEIVYNIIKERYFFSHTSNPYIRNATERTQIRSYRPYYVDYTDDKLAEAVAREIKPEATPETVTNTAVKEAEKEAKPQTTPEEAAKKAAEEAKKEAERQELRKKAAEVVAKLKAEEEAKQKKEKDELHAKWDRDDENRRKVYERMYKSVNRGLQSVPQDMSDPLNYLSALRVVSGTSQAYDKSWDKYLYNYSWEDPNMTKWKDPGIKTLPSYTPGKQQNLYIDKTGFFLPGSSKQEMPRRSYIRSDGSIDTYACIYTLAENVPEVKDTLTKMSDALLERIPVQQEGKEKGKPIAESAEYLDILQMDDSTTVRVPIHNRAMEALDKKFTETEQQSVAESEKEITNFINALTAHTSISKEDAKEIVNTIIKERSFFSQTSNPYIRNTATHITGLGYDIYSVSYTDDKLAEAVAREIKPIDPPVVIAVETQGSADIINGIHSNTRTQAQNDVEGQSIAAQDLNDAVTTSGTNIVSATTRSGSNVTNAVSRNNNITITQQANNPLLFQVAGTDPTSLNC